MNQNLLILMPWVPCSCGGYRLGKSPRFLWFIKGGTTKLPSWPAKWGCFATNIGWLLALETRKEWEINHTLKVLGLFFFSFGGYFCLNLLSMLGNYWSMRPSSRVFPVHIYLILQKSQWLQEQDPLAWRKAVFPFANHYIEDGFLLTFHIKFFVC